MSTESETNPNANRKAEGKRAEMKLSLKFFTFDKQSYPQVLQGKISKQQWEQIAVEATRAIGTGWSMKKNAESIQLPKKMRIASYATIILLIIFFVLQFIHGSTKKDTKYLLIISMIAAIVALVLSFVLVIYNFVRTLPEEKSLNYYFEREMKKYLDGLNSRYRGKAIFRFNIDERQIECDLISK